jgi:hypothetical protein
MKLSDLFEQLCAGEFRQFYIGGADEGAIQPANYGKIVPHINLALADLFKRFPLKTKTQVIQLYEHIQLYVLNPKYALTNESSTELYKYIMDSPYDPFTDGSEVLMIESVYDEEGKELILNDELATYSVFTPTYNSIQIPYNDEYNALTVQYRCGHPKLVSTGEDVLDQEVEITASHLLAVLLFIAGRYLTTFGTAENTQAGIDFMNRYEMECVRLESLNLVNRENTSNLKLEENDWV